jgi:hypothetical protein
MTYASPPTITTLNRIAVSAVATCALLMTALAPSAQAATYQVVGTGGTLHVRTAPSLRSSIVGNLRDGTSIDIVCQTRGDQVGNSTMWDKIDQPVAGYVADWYTSTPVVDNPSPGLPTCGTPTPTPTPTPPTFADIAASYNGQREVPVSIAAAWHVGPHWSGYCEAFVGLVSLKATGHGRGYGSAIADYRDHLRRGLIHGGKPPRGAIVYWNTGGPGHIGISLGNGLEISTYGYTGWDAPIQIHSYKYFRNYLGWAMI